MTDFQQPNFLDPMHIVPTESRRRFSLYTRQGWTSRHTLACHRRTGGCSLPYRVSEEWAVAANWKVHATGSDHAKRAEKAVLDQPICRRSVETNPNERFALNYHAVAYSDRPPLTFAIRFTSYG